MRDALSRADRTAPWRRAAAAWQKSVFQPNSRSLFVDGGALLVHLLMQRSRACSPSARQPVSPSRVSFGSRYKMLSGMPRICHLRNLET
jgi:hypothetical protein